MSQFLRNTLGLNYPLNIQLFGADDGGGGGTPTEPNNPDGKPTEPKDTDGGGKPTFDDILKEGHQAEFDRRVQKALDTAKSSWDKTIEDIVSGKLTEAQKLEKMSEAQKQEYERQKQIKALDEREKEITRRELQATAKVALVDKGLPATFADLLNYADADSVNTSIDVLSKAWSEAVQAGVQNAIKSNAVPKGGQVSNQAKEKMDDYRKIAGVLGKQKK